MGLYQHGCNAWPLSLPSDLPLSILVFFLSISRNLKIQGFNVRFLGFCRICSVIGAKKALRNSGLVPLTFSGCAICFRLPGDKWIVSLYRFILVKSKARVSQPVNTKC